MRVMVFEASFTGHVYTHVRILLSKLIELTDNVCVVVQRDAAQTDEFRFQLEHLSDRIQWEPCIPAPSASRMRTTLSRMSALKQAIRRLGPDHVYVPSADGISQMLALTRLYDPRPFPDGVEAEAAIARGGFAYPSTSARAWMNHFLSLQTAERSPWTCLHHLDVVAYDWIIRRGGPMARRSRLLPSPIEPSPDITFREARRRMGLPESGRLVGCTGMINGRKGIDLLLKAFVRANLPPDDRLLLVGRHAAPIRQLLENDYAQFVQEGRIISIDRYVRVDELETAMAALDLVCTPHNRPVGISSIALRATAAGRPVLASDFGWNQAIVPSLGLGWTCHVQDTDQFAEALRRCLDLSSAWELGEAGRRLVKFHAPSNFASVWTERLRERMGLSRDSICRWEWVLEATRGESSDRQDASGRGGH